MASPYPRWIPCPDCDDFYCTVHRMHVYDCPCRGIEYWARRNISPYDEAGKPMPKAKAQADTPAVSRAGTRIRQW